MSQPAKTEILPFDPAQYEAAAALLAARHGLHCTANPLLPALEPAAAVAAIADLLERPGAAAAAMRAGQLVGFLLGDLQIDQTWGRSAWMRLPGWAVAPDVDLDLLGELYAVVGEWWLRQGIFDHYVLVPATDQAALMTWLRLGFAIQQVYALADLTQLEPFAVPADLEIRRAGPEDHDTLAELSSLIWSHQIRAPIWAMTLPERTFELREGYAEMAGDSDVAVWLAFYAGEIAGFQAYFPATPAPGDLLTPADCVELSVAGTRPEFRGRGVASALTAYGMHAAHVAGARACITDWRSANLQAARFWPRNGFAPVAYRMVRSIDPRIAWAHAEEDVGFA